MRVRFDPATLNRDITVPRPISRQKIYKNRLGQASTSSDSTCGSSIRIDNKIDEEEGEDNEMVLGGPSDILNARAASSQSRSNGNDWASGRNDGDSDKDEEEVEEEEEEEEEEENSQEAVATEIGPQLPGLYDNYHQDDNLPIPGIIVKVISPSEDDPNPGSIDQSSSSQDNQLLMELRVREYQINFAGFAEINRFSSIDEMHEFIVNNMESSLTNEPSPKQEEYLKILLNEKGEDRFKSLVETSKGTVRRVLVENENILKKLFATASFDYFPSPLKDNNKTNDKFDHYEDRERMKENEEKIGNNIEENMKKWYMIEMIGIWLKFISDVKSYREAIKKSVLKANFGIENDRYEGIVVPLKYK